MSTTETNDVKACEDDAKGCDQVKAISPAILLTTPPKKSLVGICLNYDESKYTDDKPTAECPHPMLFTYEVQGLSLRFDSVMKYLLMKRCFSINPTN